MSRQHTISALVQNEAGTLNRLVSLFRRRGFSLASLNAGDCEQEGYSRLTLVVNGDDADLLQCLGQLEKLIDVVEVEDLGPTEAVRRELALVQVAADPDRRREIVDVVQIMGGKVVWLAPSSLAVEISDEPSKIDRMIDMLRPFGIQEIVRTGLVAMKVA